MSTKRITAAKYATLTTSSGQVAIKEEMLPVLIQDPNSDEPQYAYATFTTNGDSNEVTVTPLTPEEQELLNAASVEEYQQQHHSQPSQRQIQFHSNSNVFIGDFVDGDDDEEVTQEQLLQGKELIIDENGQTFTIHHLITDNGSPLTEVETLDEVVDEEDGEHTILHIVPASEVAEEELEEDVEHEIEESEMCIDESGNVIRVLTTEQVLQDLTGGSEGGEQQQGHEDIITVTENEMRALTSPGTIINVIGDISQANEDSMGVSTFSCSTGDEEDFEFNEMALAEAAQRSGSGSSKTFYCPNCGNCYSAAGSLKLHMRACLRKKAEVPEEDRKCNVCNKVFNSVSYLKVHKLRHSSDGPKRCNRCYRKFADEDKWKQHIDQHAQQDKLEAEAEALTAQRGGNKKIVVKEFNCSFCSKNFTVIFESGQVKRRYACDPCREKYSNAEMLKQHKQLVEEKRDFHCERCGRKFVFEGFLQRHLPTCDGTIKRRRDMK